jgi:hypothetical protein
VDCPVTVNIGTGSDTDLFPGFGERPIPRSIAEQRQKAIVPSVLGCPAATAPAAEA